MKIGIVGLKSSGKTTLFSAFLGLGARGADPSRKTGVVEVPDKRLNKLADHFNSSRRVSPTVTIVDCPPLDTRVKQERVHLDETLRQMDALVLLVGAHLKTTADQITEEAEKTRFEIVMKDLDFISSRREHLKKDLKLGAVDRSTGEKEMELLDKLQSLLEKEKFPAADDFKESEKTFLTTYNLPTLKPICFVLNVPEDMDDQSVEKAVTGVKQMLEKTGDSWPVLAVNTRLEAEISAMEPEDMQAFMKEFGIEKLGRERVIRVVYDLLDQITFFTRNKDESRAWNITRGSTAIEAADTIHSDIARGFIRAEVINYQLLLELGSLNQARKSGQLEVVGKDYVVRDGDFIHVLFNV